MPVIKALYDPMSSSQILALRNLIQTLSTVPCIFGSNNRSSSQYELIYSLWALPKQHFKAQVPNENEMFKNQNLLGQCQHPKSSMYGPTSELNKKNIICPMQFVYPFLCAPQRAYHGINSNWPFCYTIKCVCVPRCRMPLPVIALTDFKCGMDVGAFLFRFWLTVSLFFEVLFG